MRTDSGMERETHMEQQTAAQKEHAQKQILNRLNRARGQLGAVIAAVENGRSCREVVTQLAAVSSAIDRAGFAIVASAMTYCVTEPTDAGPWGEEEALSLAELEKIFLMLS